MVAAAAERFGSRPAIIDGTTPLTYDELVDQARRFGAALVASGIEPGDRVAIWAYNSAEWVVAALGVFEAGAVLVPVNTRFKGPEAADILRRSRARALVTVTDFLGTDYVAMLGDAGTELPDLVTIVVAHGPTRPGTEGWDAFMARATGAGPRGGAAPGVGRSAPTTPPTSCSPRGPPASPRGWSRPTAAPCWWPPTGWP